MLCTCVSQNCSDNHHDEEGEDEDEVCAQHALALLEGSKAAKEGDNRDEHSDDDDDVGGGGVEADVKLAVKVGHGLLGLLEEVEEGGLVHKHPDATS